MEGNIHSLQDARALDTRWAIEAGFASVAEKGRARSIEAAKGQGKGYGIEAVKGQGKNFLGAKGKGKDKNFESGKSDGKGIDAARGRIRLRQDDGSEGRVPCDGKRACLALRLTGGYVPGKQLPRVPGWQKWCCLLTGYLQEHG